MIPSAYLIELANYTDDKIDKVVVNGSLEITDFSIKQVTASTVELEYMIPNGTPDVTIIELKSSSDQVITSNDVYVPITTDTIIKQTVQVREV